MSAFVIDPDTMSNAVRAIIYGRGPRKGQIIPTFAGYGTFDFGSETAIGRALYRLNIRAVQARYPDTLAEPANMPGPKNACTLATYYQYSPDVTNLHDGLKALRSLLYQCNEGDIPTTELYRELEAAIATVEQTLKAS